MAERQVALVFISTLLFAAAQAESGQIQGGQDVDIEKFVQEPKISVYEATEERKHDIFHERHQTSHFQLRGVFGPAHEGEPRLNKMSVYMVENGGKKLSDETMLYSSPDGICGVFKVEENAGESWYDVRVKDDTVKHNHTSCLEFYNNLRRDTNSRSVYQNTCPPVDSNIKE
ncbi:hypothetical protein V5799_009193 [Amblyomma americanum]|uniref:Lipocalin n=1 Tax=Amblyomma americanum TaxID=6943 RepID=A0AAQ4FCE9_AMBAM